LNKEYNPYNYSNQDYQQEFKAIMEGNIGEKLGLKIDCTNIILKILKIAYEWIPQYFFLFKVIYRTSLNLLVK